MKHLDKSNKVYIEMYLDYVNNFLTVSKFAEYYNITEVDAHYIIDLGRTLNNELAEIKNN